MWILKPLSGHQQLVSLSSMEAELFALQSVAQEIASLGKLVGRILKSLAKTSVDEIPTVLTTDSESSLKLLRNLDTPRRSRHLEIKLEWQEQAKCFATSHNVIHRCSLGFATCEGPFASLTKSFGNFI